MIKTQRVERSLHIFIFLIIIAAALFSVFSFIAIKTNVDVISSSLNSAKSLFSGSFDDMWTKMRSSLFIAYDIAIAEIIILASAVIISLFAINYLINIYFGAARKSLIDELTGIYNRRALYKILDQEIKRAERFKHPLTIVMMDVDHFKVYNDKNGHLAGDALLQKMTSLIDSKIREVDTFGRYGGEEFLVILPETPHEGAVKLGEKIRKAVENATFSGEKTQPGGRVTVSMGLVTFHGEYKDRHHLIDAADELLYQAKEGGRNRVVKAHYKDRGIEESNLHSKD